MEAFAIYLFRSVIWLTGFAVVYLLFLRNERFFLLKRVYLLTGIFVSLVCPLISIHYQVTVPVPAVNTDGILPVSSIPAESPLIPVRSFDYRILLLFLYLTGIIILGYRLARHIFLLNRTISKSKIIYNGPARLVRAAGFRASFSFFNYVFINPSTDESEVKEIMNHELVHISQKHWLDLLLAEVLRIIQWINPFVWIYTGLIRLNHEYMADEGALQHTVDPANYRAALINQLFRSPVLSLSNSFNYSLNKKRFDMMKKIINSPYRKLKVLLVLPVVAGVFYAFATPEYQYVSRTGNTDNVFTIYKAQPIVQKEVKGIVLDENGKPLKGVQVTSTGTTGKAFGAYSDSDGRFVIYNVQEDAYLLFFLRGYKGQTIKADFSSEMVIKMAKDPDYKESDYRTAAQDSVSQSKPPLVVFDGVVTDEPAAVLLSKLGAEIGTIKRLTGKDATDKYGEAGEDGVIEIYSVELATKLKLIAFRRKEPDDFPTFQGKSYVSFDDWVVSQTKYPEEASANGIQGRIMARYTIEENGSMSKAEVMGQPNSLLADAVIKTIQASPKWNPAKNPETYGSFESTISIKFELPDKVLKDDVYVVAEKMPVYPGGDKELLMFIANNTKYPEAAKFEKAQGRVIVRFIVNTEGNVEDAIILKGINPYLDAEALKVVNMLSGFEPASQGGKPVSVYYMVPITFTLR